MASKGASMAVVVIDPGHGGTARVGGSSPNNAVGPTGLLEKWVTLDLARRVRALLKAGGVDARLTRDEDRNVGLAQRAAIARAAGADAFVSIHLNGFNNTAQGTETFHHTAASADSKALAGLVQGAVRKATGLTDRGVKAAAYGVVRPDLHAPATAACLVEVSFMDVAAEEARLKTEAYKDVVARALAGAVRAWLLADRRLAAAPELAMAEAVAEAAGPGGEPQDGFESERGLSGPALPILDIAEPLRRWTGTPAPDPPPREPPRRAPAAADSRNLAERVPFLAIPDQRLSPAAGAGIADLGRMATGWRVARIAPEAVEVTPEIIIEEDDSLGAVFLQLLAQKRLGVGLIRAAGRAYDGQSGRWSGTGFLVSPNILLTNHHVLNDPEVARGASVVFDYEVSAAGLAGGDAADTPTGREYRLDPDRLFITSPYSGGLDYTFVWIDGFQPGEGAIIRMERAAFAVTPQERAFLIHHPRGKPKRVSLQDAEVVTARPDGAVIHYVSDSEPGSSGCPVFDRTGRLIALHHASRANSDGARRRNGLTPSHVNEGIKLAAIALDLETRRRTEPNAMYDAVLGEIYGSDTLTGFFGAAGRNVERAGAERVVDIYNATAQDVDVGFWNIEWFARQSAEKVDDVARMIVDLGLDIWALIETSPPATEALVRTIEARFGLQLTYAHSEPDAPGARQSTAVLWNPNTVQGERLAWPAEIDRLFQLRSEDLAGAEALPASKPGKIFGRYPALFRFKGLGRSGGGIDFNLVPLHLKAMDEGREWRRQASYLLARAVDLMVREHGADQDWVLGGDWNAALASGDFDALVDKAFTPVSAQDEADGGLSYLKSPRSLIDHVFLSPNMSRLFGQQDGFILAKEKSQVDYMKRFSDHRPVMLRLSARAPGSEAAAPGLKDAGLAALVDAVLQGRR
ncbi:MAG: N-acetylmuramoyl-L-alanine amidase [Phenylobacterium sp.]